jgi:peptidoglycan hydrolase-like protein with peptidoglycan-binding domain
MVRYGAPVEGGSVMWQRRNGPRLCRVFRRCRRCTGVVLGVVLITACSSDDASTPSAPSTTQDPVAAAEARVSTAQSSLETANDALTAASQQFCNDAKDYVTAVDRYGKVFTDATATVGDVKTAGSDLVAPRESVTSAADAVVTAKTDVANADKELTDAKNALGEAKATASSVPAPSTAPPPTTTTLVAQSTINHVQQAEDDLAKTSGGITDSTPLTQATVEYNAAALELEVAWLQLLNQAGCLTDQQQSDAATQLSAYTTALQTDLQKAGYYKGPIDGIYGPQTVAAVKQLQTDNGLPVTGLVDQATAQALDKKLAELGQQAAAQQQTQTAALQTVLTLTGYWTGPIDGNWTPELTDALKRFQTALGVAPTGAVDAATLAAFQQALANAKSAATTTTTPTTTTPPTRATTAPTTTVTRPSTTTSTASTSTT